MNLLISLTKLKVNLTFSISQISHVVLNSIFSKKILPQQIQIPSF